MFFAQSAHSIPYLSETIAHLDAQRDQSGILISNMSFFPSRTFQELIYLQSNGGESMMLYLGVSLSDAYDRAEAEVSAKMLCAEQSSCRLQRQINSIEKTLNKQKNSINRHHSTLKNAAEEADALSQKLTATHMNLRRADGVVNELRSSLRQLEFRVRISCFF